MTPKADDPTRERSDSSDPNTWHSGDLVVLERANGKRWAAVLDRRGEAMWHLADERSFLPDYVVGLAAKVRVIPGAVLFGEGQDDNAANDTIRALVGAHSIAHEGHVSAIEELLRIVADGGTLRDVVRFLGECIDSAELTEEMCPQYEAALQRSGEGLPAISTNLREWMTVAARSLRSEADAIHDTKDAEPFRVIAGELDVLLAALPTKTEET